MMCFVGIFGIIIMIIQCEIIFASDDSLHMKIVFFLQLVTTISTIALIILAVVYHYYDLNLYCVNNSVEDWRVGLTLRRTILIAIEVLICAIHPFPRQFSVSQPSDSILTISNSSTISNGEKEKKSLSYIYVDVALGLPSKSILIFTLLLKEFYICLKCFFVSICSLVLSCFILQ